MCQHHEAERQELYHMVSYQSDYVMIWDREMPVAFVTRPGTPGLTIL